MREAGQPVRGEPADRRLQVRPRERAQRPPVRHVRHRIGRHGDRPPLAVHLPLQVIMSVELQRDLERQVAREAHGGPAPVRVEHKEVVNADVMLALASDDARRCLSAARSWGRPWRRGARGRQLKLFTHSRVRTIATRLPARGRAA